MPERVATNLTIADALEEAAGRLAASDGVEPRREARALWGALAGVDPGTVWLRRERAAPPDLLQRFRAAVDQRVNGFPFAYAAGWTAFRTLRLKIDQRALIPRPETEGLVELALGARGSGLGTRNSAAEPRAPSPESPEGGGVAADIGTGCGCIALSLAVEGTFDRVIAVERSPEAVLLARENVALVKPRVPVEVRHGDLLAPLAGERCRVIVANPPYLTESEYQKLDPAVREFEPRPALVSGAHGLEATHAILAVAQPLLEPCGLLALEIDERRADLVLRLARELGWPRAALYDDLFGRPRYLLAGLQEDT